MLLEIILAVCWLATLSLLIVRHYRERARLRLVAESVEGRSLHLAEDITESGIPEPWQRLVAATNDLIEEGRRKVTDREAHLRRLRGLLDALREAVIIADEAGQVVIANTAARELFSERGELAGLRLPKLLPSADFLTFADDVRRGAEGRPTELTLELSGRPVCLVVGGRRLEPAGADEPSWMAFVLRDVSRERELEGLQRDLIGNVSHELRTPISVIRGYAETLAEDHGRMGDDDRGRFIQAIRRHSLRLSSLVEDLLTLGRLESKYPGFEYERVDAHGEIRELAADVEARARAGAHAFTLVLDAAESTVRADAFRLSQVLENLVENALKYGGQGASIRIETRNEPGFLLVGVIDNGPGIPARDQPRIFERFYRVEKGRSRDKGGTGLGLTIAREIVELHGGRIWVESDEGRGTAFWFSLPLSSSGARLPQVP